jgi:hypothetical protein
MPGHFHNSIYSLFGYNLDLFYKYIDFFKKNVCTMMQESRKLEMNNVQDGTWHGRGDTKCIGSFGEKSISHFELHPPPIVSIK